MFISKFDRIDTVTIPDVFMSVITVSDGDGEYDGAGIRSMLEADKDSIDFLAVKSDSDPLDFPMLYKLLKEVRPPSVKVMIITTAYEPGALDDLCGGGYAHAVDFLVKDGFYDDQEASMELTRDNGCDVYVTVDLKGQTEESISDLAKKCKGCKMFIMKQDRNDPLKKSDLSRLSAAAKAHVWNVRIS